MKISFQKQVGEPALNIAFFWRLEIKSDSPQWLTDHFIPELAYDYFMVCQGDLQVEGEERPFGKQPFPQQTLKTIHTRPLTLRYATPLVLFGARLSLRFAESFWQPAIAANQFLTGNWVKEPIDDLDVFAAQVRTTVAQRRIEVGQTAVLQNHTTLEETPWFANYSPRHKRRLYKSTFGVSRKEMQTIQNVHTFLTQSCDFSAHNPSIIDHLNDEQFYDQPHLNNTFKKVTGFSLLDYFEAHTMLQDNLMAVSYNEISS